MVFFPPNPQPDILVKPCKTLQRGRKYRFLPARIMRGLVSACRSNCAPLRFPNDPPHLEPPITWASFLLLLLFSSFTPSQPACVALRQADWHNANFPCCCLSSGTFRRHRGWLLQLQPSRSRLGSHTTAKNNPPLFPQVKVQRFVVRKSIPAQN